MDKGDLVISKYHGNGEIIIVDESIYVIAWDVYRDGLFSSDDYVEYSLPEYDERYYGTYTTDDIKKYEIIKMRD